MFSSSQAGFNLEPLALASLISSIAVTRSESLIILPRGPPKSRLLFFLRLAKYDMAVGHLLLKSFWANEAVFQMMMLSYNLFLLFKFDSLDSSEYRQQIKTFRLKYVFLAAKIIKTARYVIMKLSENYPYKGVYEKCLV